MIFTKQHFVEVVLKILFDGLDLQEELANTGVIRIVQELSRITVSKIFKELCWSYTSKQNFYMWSTESINYKYRSRYWLLFSPIWRTQEILGNYKKRVALTQQGIESDAFVSFQE